MIVFLAGEGVHELGDWYDRTYRSDPPRRGIIEALLRIHPGGCEIAGAVAWKAIRKFRAGDHRRPETRNILGAVEKASELDCDALIFVRDRDSDGEREQQIEDGIQEAGDLFPEVKVTGGVAIEQIEAWILAILGRRGSERHRDSKQTLAEAGKGTGREMMIDLIDACDLAALPDDATSLRRWLGRVRATLETAE